MVELISFTIFCCICRRPRKENTRMLGKDINESRSSNVLAQTLLGEKRRITGAGGVRGLCE